MAYGTIINANGDHRARGRHRSSACCTEILDEPYLHAGIDAFFHMSPPRYLWGAQWGRGSGSGEPRRPSRANACGRHAQLLSRRSRGRAILRTGRSYVFLATEWVNECAELFADIPAYFDRRALPAGDPRTARAAAGRSLSRPSARTVDRVHRHITYDFEVDTAAADAVTCAAAIRQYLSSGAAPSGISAPPFLRLDA